MKERTAFSVSMCVYGGDNPVHFKRAIGSILEQFPDEVVLVVDGPVPAELDTIISEYENNSIFNVIRFEENKGHGNARRCGLEHCTNDLVALMDADDVCMPGRFEKQLKMFSEDDTLSIVGGNISEFVGAEENIVGYRNVPQTHHELTEYIKKRCPFNQMTVMFKKSDVQSVGGYIDWYCDEDYYLWLRMYMAGMKFANLPDVLVNVRVGEDMYKRRGGLRYFKSEAKLQKYMLDNKVIGIGTYIMNVIKRLIVQVLLPNSLRGFVFKRFARSGKVE